jgi:hypothetical protein
MVVGFIIYLFIGATYTLPFIINLIFTKSRNTYWQLYTSYTSRGGLAMPNPDGHVQLNSTCEILTKSKIDPC